MDDDLMAVPTDAVERARQLGLDLRQVDVGGRSVLVGRTAQFRWSWFATQLHTFVFLAHLATPTVAELESFSLACLTWAKENKGGLPHGLQTGTASMPVIYVDTIADDVRAWATELRGKRFACISFPAVVGPDGTALVAEDHLTWGAIYDDHLRNTAAMVTGDEVARPSGEVARRRILVIGGLAGLAAAAIAMAVLLLPII